MIQGETHSLQAQSSKIPDQHGNDEEIAKLKAEIAALRADNDELKHHRRELRALCELYQAQTERYKQEEAGAKERLRRAEEEADRQRTEKLSAQTQADALRAERDKARADFDKYEQEKVYLEKGREAAHRVEDQVMTIAEIEDRNALPPPKREGTPLADPIELDLEYVSDEPDIKVESRDISIPKKSLTPRGSPFEPPSLAERSAAMRVEARVVSQSVGHELASNTSAVGASDVQMGSPQSARGKSPSLEILDAPSAIFPLRTRTAKNSDDTKTVPQPYATALSQPVVKSLGKRKVAAVGGAVEPPSKKMKGTAVVPLATTPPAPEALVSRTAQPGSLSIHPAEQGLGEAVTQISASTGTVRSPNDHNDTQPSEGSRQEAASSTPQSKPKGKSKKGPIRPTTIAQAPVSRISEQELNGIEDVIDGMLEEYRRISGSDSVEFMSDWNRSVRELLVPPESAMTSEIEFLSKARAFKQWRAMRNKQRVRPTKATELAFRKEVRRMTAMGGVSYLEMYEQQYGGVILPSNNGAKGKGKVASSNGGITQAGQCTF